MPSLKKLNKSISSEQTTTLYKAKTVIYVEGDSDQKIFANYWFRGREQELDFKPPPSGSGCAAVVNQVKTERLAGISAWGIVDRDKLMADGHMTVLHETDDAKFDAARPYGPHVKVTQRWELESYLLEPEVIEEHLAAHHSGRGTRPREHVVQELLKHADALVPHAAANQVLHQAGISALPDKFGLDAKCRADMASRVLAQQAKWQQAVKDSYPTHVNAIDAFGSAVTPDEIRYFGLLRAVNGKAMLERLKHANGINYELEYQLASRFKHPPQEVADYVNSCCSTSAA